MTADLVEKIPALEREADELERKAAAIRQVVAGLRAWNGDANAALLRTFASHRTSFAIGIPEAHAPRGREAVRTVMEEEPDRLWKVVDLKKEVLRRGWAPTPKAVEASIARLRDEGEVVSPQYGFYKLVSRNGDAKAPTPNPAASGSEV